MCGIIISKKQIINIEYVNKFCKNRGPDITNNVIINNINFVHNLLHNTGNPHIQPLTYDNNNYIAIFNGEIYNYKQLCPDAESDGECIIPMYLKYGNEFIKWLDGDFCIILFDFKKNILIISADIFKTKPLFYHISNEELIISSYLSCCTRINSQLVYNEINPNECLIFSLDSNLLIDAYKIYEFDLNQYKTNYDDWTIAFEEAILKRYPEQSTPLICLSSGMDSGSICCCLKKYNKKFYPISIPKNENEDILKNRKKQHDNLIFLNLTDEDKNKWKGYLNENCESCSWNWYNQRNGNNWTVDAFNMGSMLGTSHILDYITKIDNKCRVMMTGIGSDEVMATHSSYDKVNWGQLDYFPQKLNDKFPWFNFYTGSQSNYIRGQEYIGGCFSFETRYPYLDKKVVQEFLWLTPELKNGKSSEDIKPALMNYLNINNYPYKIEKFGFNV